MATILNEAKKLYPMFFENGHWDEGKANELLGGKKDIEKRKETIHSVYKILLEKKEGALNKYVQKWITQGSSLGDIAKFSGQNVNNLKTNVNYFDRTIGDTLRYDGKSVMYHCACDEVVEWNKVEECFEALAVKYGHRVYKKDKAIGKNSLLVNIPSGEYSKSVNDADFKKFIDLVAPYFVNQRKLNQEKINSMAEMAGYFNYLMTPGLVFSEKDKSWQKKILSLLSEEEVKEFRAENRKKVASIKNIEETNTEEKRVRKFEDWTEEEKAASGPKSTRIQYSF